MSEKTPFKTEDGFILPLFYHLFRFLRKFSAFELIRAIARLLWAHKHHCTYADAPDNAAWNTSKPFPYRYIFPEIWALGNLTASVFAGTLAYLCTNNIIQIILLIYAIERTVELFVYQVNVLLFDPIASKQKYQIKSATRMVILLIMNMIEYTFWFSCIYTCLGILLDGTSTEGFVFVFESFNTFMSLSTPTDMPSEHFQLLAFIEALVGMFMNLICLARFIGLLPTVDTIDDN